MTDFDILLMIENMKDYDKNKELSYLKYWDVNNLYGSAMSQKLPVYNFKWVEIISEFDNNIVKKYIEENDEGHFLEIDFQYSENLQNFHNDLTFLPEGMKNAKVEKLVPNLYDKQEYVIHIRNLKQALNHGFVLKKVHRVIKFNQKAWLKSYIDINTELKRNTKNDFLSWWIMQFLENHDKC